MKNIIFSVILFGVLVISGWCMKPTLPDTIATPTNEIKYLKPQEKFPEDVYIESKRRAKDENNKIIAIKEADENHVKVVQRMFGLSYPDVEYIDNTTFFRNRSMPNLVMAKKDGKWGVIDFQGKIIVPFKYDYQVSPTKFDYFICVIPEYKDLDFKDDHYSRTMGIFDKDGKMLLDFKYNNIVPMSNECCIVHTGDDIDMPKFKYLTVTGKDVLGEEFNDYKIISDDLFVTTKWTKKENYLYGAGSVIYNIKGEEIYKSHDETAIIPVNKADNTTSDYSNHYFTIYDAKNKISKLTDMRGNVIFDGVLNVLQYSEGLYIGFSDKWIFMDHNRKVLFEYPTRFGIMPLKSGLMFILDISKGEKAVSSVSPKEFLKNKKYIIMDSEGKIIFETECLNVLFPVIDGKNIMNNDSYDSMDINCIAFVSEGKSTVLNVNTLETKEYDKEAEIINNDGTVYYDVGWWVFNGNVITTTGFMVPME